MKMDAEQKTKKLLNDALHLGASDIHFIPQEQGGFIRYRVDGKLIVMERSTDQLMKRLISHLKFISGMDIGERRRPQNRRLEMRIMNETVTMRLSTFPSSAAESLVIRLFPQQRALLLDSLPLFPAQTDRLKQLIQKPSGLIIICGPTGAGKTTTLYSLINKRQEGQHENVITLEDPVENRDSRFLQMEINEKAGVTYAAGLKSLLRHDPDLIMLGEIRDSETAKMAVRAALTGRLVMTTLHSSSAAGALKRLYDLGLTRHDLQEVVQGICSQRLVNILCPFCGDVCHIYCRKRRLTRRKAVFEILQGKELRSCLEIERKDAGKTYPVYSMDRALRKALALGFIPLSETQRLQTEEAGNGTNIPK